jgi:hypothetical protein
MKMNRLKTTIKSRMMLLDGYRDSNLSQRAFGKGNGLKLSTFRHWLGNEEKYSNVKDQNQRLRLASTPSTSLFINLEGKLMEWIHRMNNSGVPIKGKNMIAYMQSLRDERLNEISENDEEFQALNSFNVSKGWLQRFLNRFNIVRRTRAKSHKIPDDYPSIARNFIEEVQETIHHYNIKRENIFNFDQVPRYFDMETSHTYTVKGSKDVQVRESCHKRFTFTPVIAANGEFTLAHLLFSKLVKVPKVNDGCIADVNKTGMWSQTILTNFIDKKLIPKIRSRTDDVCLIIFDSYSVHQKFVKESISKGYTEDGIIFKLIPPCMTPILQPLDVAVNRSFQQHFNDSYIKYLREAVSNPVMQTKHGNVKTPNYMLVSDWVLKWMQSKSHQDIRKSFDVCGLVPVADFNPTSLHSKLKKAFELNINE